MEFNKQKHFINRNNFYGKYPEFFPNLNNKEYALYDHAKLSKEVIENIRIATEKIWDIYSTTFDYICGEPHEKLTSLGFDLDYLSFVWSAIPKESFLSRLDLIVNNDGTIKLMENNADTPFLELESFKMNGEYCRKHNLINPNEACENDLIQLYLNEIRDFTNSKDMTLDETRVVIVGNEKNEEEYKQIQFIIKSLSKYMKIEFVKINEMLFLEDEVFHENDKTYYRGLYNQNRERVDVVLRFGHPMEYIIQDKSKDNTNVGFVLLEFVDEELVKMLNPTEAFIMQPKKIMSLIWELTNRNDVFTLEQKEAIKTYFLPTFNTPDYFIENKLSYVEKSNLGREGNTVKIFNENNELVKKSKKATFSDFGYVYQAFNELPEIEAITVDGSKNLKYIVTSFVVNNKPSAIAMRVGTAITEDDSYWIPIAQID